MDIKVCFIISFLIIYVQSEYISYEGYKVYKVVPRTPQDVTILKQLHSSNKYNFWTDLIKEMSEVKIMVGPENQEEFIIFMESNSIKLDVAIEDVKKVIEDQKLTPTNNRANPNYAWDYYQPLEELHAWLRKIAEDYPDVVTLVNIGRTVENREILGVKIDYLKRDNATFGMIEGGIHAREWISPAFATWAINEFLTSTDEGIRGLAENVVWHIFPVVNPDGYVYTFTNNRLWRKNRNSANHQSCAQWNLNDDMSNGIDLNRNFGFMWMTTGASSNPCAETFAGPTANSEMETVAIINYVTNIQQEGNLVYYFAFHSYTQLVLIPYSHVGGANVFDVPNYADLFEIGIKGADKLKRRHGTHYEVGTSADILYEVSGSSFDWAKGDASVPIVYLFELRDMGEFGFLLSPKLIVPNNEEMMDALVEVDRVTRSLGYYTRSGAVMNTISSLFICFMIILTL